MVILVDGFIVSAAMLAAGRLNAAIEDYMIFAHLSDEHAHSELLAAMQGKPLLRLGMRLGEGSGAAVCLPLIYSAVNFLNKMAGFEDAAVSGKIS
jgi:nicotinate-nucleotide--dimethylbenzimidazole phosphoribosyltransferase